MGDAHRIAPKSLQLQNRRASGGQRLNSASNLGGPQSDGPLKAYSFLIFPPVPISPGYKSVSTTIPLVHASTHTALGRLA